MKNLLATAASVLVLGLAAPAMAVDSNNSNVNQDGYGQTVEVEQIGSRGAVNTSTIEQGLGAGDSYYNYAKVTQDGTRGLKNTSTIYQDGVSNISLVDQKGDGRGGDQNTSTIDQDGTGNFAKVTQSDTINNNYSYVKQNGSYNAATVNQH